MALTQPVTTITMHCGQQGGESTCKKMPIWRAHLEANACFFKIQGSGFRMVTGLQVFRVWEQCFTFFPQSRKRLGSSHSNKKRTQRLDGLHAAQTCGPAVGAATGWAARGVACGLEVDPRWAAAEAAGWAARGKDPRL